MMDTLIRIRMIPSRNVWRKPCQVGARTFISISIQRRGLASKTNGSSTAGVSPLLRSKAKESKKPTLNLKRKNVSRQPTKPARTRFAPSPTGFLHLGSLRTALYNYLLAKSTGGQFLLRLEDTDRKRLVPGAEENIYETLRWCGITIDEGPEEGGPVGPYRQSDRREIYKQYIEQLIDSGHAYRCFCSKERLDNLRESAMQLQPPTTATYDRHCYSMTEEEVASKLEAKEPYTVRFRSPAEYPVFTDLLHGKINHQVQTNPSDVRYDDIVLMKSDGLPTYHFANVVDDHLMKVTHVVRGEEWMPATPKHIALYTAFGWTAPEFVHIPLLTSIDGDKKLSKRSGDIGILSMRDRGIFPEAVVNFVALFGWSPKRNDSESLEIYPISELEKLFSVDDLTKGNAKVDMRKLMYFNKYYLSQRLANESTYKPLLEECFKQVQEKHGDKFAVDFVAEVLKIVGPSLFNIKDFYQQAQYFFETPVYDNEEAQNFLHAIEEKGQVDSAVKLLEYFSSHMPDKHSAESFSALTNEIVSELNLPKRLMFESLRFALSGSKPGTKLPVLFAVLSTEDSSARLTNGINHLKQLTK